MHEFVTGGEENQGGQPHDLGLPVNWLLKTVSEGKIPACLAGVAWLGLRRGVFTCVGWQVTLCDPIWQVTLCSSVMGFLLRAILVFNLLTLKTESNVP